MEPKCPPEKSQNWVPEPFLCDDLLELVSDFVSCCPSRSLCREAENNCNNRLPVAPSPNDRHTTATAENKFRRRLHTIRRRYSIYVTIR
jgi:hypothetical protein